MQVDPEKQENASELVNNVGGNGEANSHNGIQDQKPVTGYVDSNIVKEENAPDKDSTDKPQLEAKVSIQALLTSTILLITTHIIG